MHAQFHAKRVEVVRHVPSNANSITLRITEHDGKSELTLFELTDTQVALLLSAFGEPIQPRAATEAIRAWL